MIIKNELTEIRAFAGRNINEILVISLATLFLILSRYHPFDEKWMTRLVYYAALPILSIILVLRKNPLDFGLRLGNVRVWRWHVAIVCVVSFGVIYIGSHISSMSGYYAARPGPDGIYRDKGRDSFFTGIHVPRVFDFWVEGEIQGRRDSDPDDPVCDPPHRKTGS